MKTTVRRALKAGIYNVNFTFSDFTPEELEKMQAFGVPAIRVQWGQPPARNSGWVALTQLGPNYNSGFLAEEEAKSYEHEVLSQVKTAMETLRQRKDDFSSSEEVNI
jgi:hypothetical protein